jgi:trk system potassium uptake protein TrkH
MNKRMIAYILGAILLIEAAFMLLPAVTALVYREAAGRWFVYTILGTAALGAAAMIFSRPRTKTIYTKDGLVTVALGWIVLSLAGALPFTLSGEIPSYLDAVFEIISGFTTTGSSILTNVEALSRCMLFWRSFSHWLGGMGVLVFMLAIVHLEGGQGIHLLRAESPGPSVSKMTPKMTDSSKILYSIYLGLTVLQIILYRCGGMPLFDSLCNTFGTAGTGGFSIKANSFNAYDAYAQTITTIFMILFGVNFSVYFFLLRKKFDLVVKNTELRWYLLIIFSSIALITINVAPMFPSVGAAIHHVAFSVASVITTTGYCTANFDLWPEFSRVILILLMIIGACAGSTGGGLKVSRVAILVKSAGADLKRLVYPNAVRTIRMDGRPVSSELVDQVRCYFFVYSFIALVSILLVALDGYDASTTISAVMATYNNIGPGLGLVGPIGNFSVFSPLSKIVLSLDMLLGRLELYPILALMMPGAWRRR